MQMDAFIQALKQNCLDLVKTFLGLDFEGKLKRHLHMGRLLRLYRQLQNTGKQEKLTHYRQKFADWLGTLTVLPLRCVGKGCPSCDVTASTRSTEPGQVVHRTCLHPIQELFLWALHDRRLEMAIVFWERCEDKIAAALVAWRVFISMAKDYSDPDIKWQLEENVRQFQDLAIQTLKSCHNMDELETELLLTKPCPWWGNNSVLQLAIMTENKEFMAQTACTNIMTLIWKGHPLKRKQNPSSVSEEKRPCQLVDTAADMGRWNRCSPFLQYCFNFIMQLLFLGLFSYGLLFDLGHGLTWIFISLIVCVAAITAEEIRQLVSKHAVLRDRSLHMSDNTQITRTKLQTYLSQGWNRVDVTTIVLFWLGLIVFIPVEECQEVGRLLLSIDIFVFFVRTIQMLMVFEELGLMLVMVHKMVKDTINFMIILLIFVLAYAVASESLLYPRSNFTADRLFHLPRKAYWQVFGELNLEEIEIRDNDSCSDSKSKHYGYDEPHCPTKYSTYFVPVLLGIHVMITNVLLLNLLIARFGVTFNKVHEEARQHQSWHRCQIIMEYYNRTAFPPPLNILAIMLSFLTRCCLLVKDCILRLWCCCKQGGRCRRSRRADENLPLLSSSLEAWRSADRRSVKITWTNRLTLAESGGQGAENGQLKQYTVEVNDTDQQECFSVARIQSEEEKEQALTVWDLDTEKDYEIYVAGHNVTLESVKATRSPEDLLKTMAFENEEAKYVRHQEDPSKSWLKDLQAQTEKLQQEIDKVARELKEDHGVLRDDIRKTDKRLRSYSKVDTFILNIKDNLEKLSNYILENVQKQKLVAGIKEAKARKGEAENELQKAKEQLSQLRSEKEAMAREFLDTTKAFEKRQRELENTVWQRLKEGQEEVKRSILLQRDVMMQALQQVLVEVRGGTGYPVPETGGDLGCGQ
ncbi:transient receptor potential cation channel subfamily M member 1-like [Babylonia areolata]|uniref:transient receptor potential cation channel subfamily M member 1-like n=1 Tax=Babylonia areolata TaxID=304850 RepID=UPI003FD1F081